MTRTGRSQFVELFLFRARTLSRDVGTLVWSFLVPAVLTGVLAFAFRPTSPVPTAVGVLAGEGAEALVKKLNTVPELTAVVISEPEGRLLLSRGRLSALVGPGSPHRLIFDPTQESARAARFQVLLGLEEEDHGSVGPRATDETIDLPGARYVDFLLPGIIGMQLMMTTSFMVGGHLATMRTTMLLKRLAASPVSPPLYYLALGAVRLVFSFLETIYFTAIGVVAFGLPMPTHPMSLLAFGAISSLSWTMVFVVLGLRARSPEGYNGISSLITTIMIFASGVFFPAERFPEMLQPFLGLLPLTALNSGLRMLMLDGASLLELGPQILVLLAWTVIPLLLPRRAMAWT